MSAVRVTTVAGNVWTGTVERTSVNVRLTTTGGDVYTIPYFRILSIAPVPARHVAYPHIAGNVFDCKGCEAYR